MGPQYLQHWNIKKKTKLSPNEMKFYGSLKTNKIFFHFFNSIIVNFSYLLTPKQITINYFNW